MLLCGRPSGEEGSIGAGGCKKEQKTAHSSTGVQNTGEDLHIRPANRERNPSGFQLPCLSSEHRSICRVSRTGIRNWGSEATTLRSAGSEQDSTRCPSRPHKWHCQFSLKGLRGVCRGEGRHPNVWIHEHCRASFCTKWVQVWLAQKSNPCPWRGVFLG